MRFFVGLHQPADCRHFARSFVSVNRLRDRRSDFMVHDWIMDSGAFTEVARHGGYRCGVAEYAAQIRRWGACGHLLAAVAQDYMCEPFVLAKTGFSVADHQRLTVERYDALRDEDTGGVLLMPVLQGYAFDDYRRHVEQYGDRLVYGQWVGVGSVCKRNGSPQSILGVLAAVKDIRPDLRLHGFGLKYTALSWEPVRSRLESADSMAWSFAARHAGRSANDWREAKRFEQRINQQEIQRCLFV